MIKQTLPSGGITGRYELVRACKVRKEVFNRVKLLLLCLVLAMIAGNIIGPIAAKHTLAARGYKINAEGY